MTYGPFLQYVAEYEAWFERNPHAYQSELRAVALGLEATAQPRVEVGVGTGLFAAPLGVRFGVEPAPSMAVRAARRGVRVARGVAEHLPLASCSTGTLLWVTTVCFVDDVHAALAEAHRVLRPGGHLVIGYVDADSRLGRAYAARRHESRFYGPATFYTTEQLVVLIRAHGFVEHGRFQTLVAPVAKLSAPEAVTRGSGDGSFVVLRTRRSSLLPMGTAHASGS